MEESMNNEMDRITEMSETNSGDQDFVSKKSQGPSKAFMTLVGGGVAALLAIGVVAFNRHKRKKLETDEDYLEDFEPDDFTTDKDIETEWDQNEEKSEEEPAGEK